MKFKLKVSKWANFYFFVQNLSEWHFSNRKSYNIFWRKRLGDFSKQEETALKEFKKIRLKYPDNKSCFEKSFFLSNNPLKELSLVLSSSEYKDIKNVFSVFRDKFQILYKKELPLLKQWQKKIDKEINNKKYKNKILISLNTLYKTSVKKKTISVYLLFSTPGGIGGGANIDDKNITLEISNYPLREIKEAIGIIWHEIVHLLFQYKYFHPLVRKYFLNNRQKFFPINEIVTASLFPEGVLGMKIFKNKLMTPRLFYGLDSSSINRVLILTKEYLDQKKYFDKEYIKKIHYLFLTKNRPAN